MTYEIINELEFIIATTKTATHEKLRHDEEKLYCTTEDRALETYIQMNLKVRLKMLQAKYPGLTKEN